MDWGISKGRGDHWFLGGGNDTKEVCRWVSAHSGMSRIWCNIFLASAKESFFLGTA